MVPKGRREKKMEVKLSLDEVRELVKNQKCFETETCFLVNSYKKYDPQLCFVLGKYFHLDGKGNPIDPIEYLTDKSFTDKMNIDFNGVPVFMFGDYWVSKKGSHCFKLKSPMTAKHLLIRIDWGGSFNRTRGLTKEMVENIPEVLYYHKASSHGGGDGYDYIIVPVGFRKSLYDEEFDGERHINIPSDNNADVYRDKFQKYLDSRFEKYDKELKELLPVDIREIEECRNKYLTEVQLAQYHLHDICRNRMLSGEPTIYISIYRLYFTIGAERIFYTEDGMERFRKIYGSFQ